MFRILGFLVGSAVSVITILLIVGIPEFHLSDPRLDQRRFDEAVEKLKGKKQEVEFVAGQVAETIGQVAETMQEPAGDIAETSDLSSGTDTPGIPAEPVPDAPLSQPEPQWHAFWNPFHSKIAAEGFVSQLEKVTGLDYRIVKVETGVYQVAFAYVDDNQRRDFLSQISAATGLEFPGQ